MTTTEVVLPDGLVGEPSEEGGNQPVLEAFGLPGKAEKLYATEPKDLKRAAGIIRGGGIAILPFNGIYGIFGNLYDKATAEKIIEAKKRPKDRKLITVVEPERVEDIVDFDRTYHPKNKVEGLWKSVHALGIILPALTNAPEHLVIRDIDNDDLATILNIWTEYAPLRLILSNLRRMGGRGLVGTSANKSGEPTHFIAEEVWRDFRNDVDAIVLAEFVGLDPIRKKSTSVIDLTNHRPKLHREGNVTEDEIRRALQKRGFPELVVGRDVITVRARKDPNTP